MRRAPVLPAAVALALAACNEKSSASADASAAASASDVDAAAPVRYDCAGLAPVEPQGACATGERPTDALVRFSGKLTELPAMHARPPAEWWEPARAALDAASNATADPKALPLVERAVIQNAALHLAVAARAGRVRTTLPVDAMKLVDRLAFTPEERTQLTARAVDLSPWLGPPAERIERTKSTPFFHEQIAHHTEVARMVRTPRLRAIFSELVAIGTDGAPFATPVVGAMEIRRGTGPDAPACIVLPSPERVRCELFAGLVEERDVAKLPHSHFFRRDEQGGLRCNQCHGLSGNDRVIGAIDLAPEAAGAELAKHRQATLDRLRPLLEPLRPVRGGGG